MNTFMAKLTDALAAQVGGPLVSSIAFSELVDAVLEKREENIDERIAKLDAVKDDLQAAIGAIDSLKLRAKQSKEEAETLQISITRLKADKDAAEALVKLPQDAATRLICAANAKGRLRGIVEGSVIGFTTGCLSSAFIWWLTTPVTQ